MSDGAGKVSYSAGKVSDGARKVSDGAGEINPDITDFTSLLSSSESTEST